MVIAQTPDSSLGTLFCQTSSIKWTCNQIQMPRPVRQHPPGPDQGTAPHGWVDIPDYGAGKGGDGPWNRTARLLDVPVLPTLRAGTQ